MRILILATLILVASLGATAGTFQTGRPTRPTALRSGSLCSTAEHIIFSCAVKATAKHPAKIVSLCASRDLDKERGYLQYRFGLPARIELEFPKERQASQRQFSRTHYLRFQVDLNEINFTIGDYQYQIFDTYNGEEKPAISEQGVSVTGQGKPKDATFICRGKPTRDYNALEDVLPRDQE